MSTKGRYSRPVVIWLMLVAFLVFLMVFIGGVTRLTDSGLSMVEWRPVTGFLPPMSDEAWNRAFDAYKAFPEYQLINRGMQLADFKYIYFWEYLHRLMGRIVGIVFFFPFLYFLWRGKVKNYKGRLLLALLLGGSQGVLGWYMVQSGLVERPDVSHFRLAAHLGLAFIIIGYLSWIIYDMILEKKAPLRQIPKSFSYAALGLLALTGLQIVYGAFVAGLDAGIGYNTWPLMEGSFIPRSAYRNGTFLQNILYNPTTIQFIHRTLAIILTAGILVFTFKLKKEQLGWFRTTTTHLGFIIATQFILGVFTIVYKVPLVIASLHQIMACILFICIIKINFVLLKKTTV